MEQGRVGSWGLVTAQHTRMVLDKSLNLSGPLFSHLSNGHGSHLPPVLQGLPEGQVGMCFERQNSRVCTGLPRAGLHLSGKRFGDLQSRVGTMRAFGLLPPLMGHALY